MKIKNLLGLILLVAFSGNAFSGEASVRLASLADDLIKDYAVKSGGAKVLLAVFPLNCEAKLEKERVGFAASEIMSHRFVAETGFTVVERAEIGRLLGEQRLQASGAVDSSAAVRVGKLLGAEVLLLGNIQKVGGRYQVNARLVNAESGAVLASGYAELPVEAFQDDARAYLNLVPETQSLGLYFLYNFRSNTNDMPVQAYTNPFTGLTSTIRPKSFDVKMLGGGLRYFPTAKLLVDVSYMGDGGGAKIDNGILGGLKVTSVRALMGIKVKSYQKFSCYLGGGVTSYSLNWTAKTNYYTPTAFIRAEYRPQARIGISISGSYDFYSKPAKQDLSWANPPVTIKNGELNKFSIEPSLAIYF